MGKRVPLLAACALLLALGACDSTGGAPAGDDTLSILEPSSGATVSTPFTVRVKTSDALGTTETGNHHIYIWFDGNEAKHQISYSDTARVTDLPDGAHKMTVSLRNADHTDAGARVEIPITVGAAGVPGY